MEARFTHARFEAALGTAALGISAGELHGLLTGYLCGDERALMELVEFVRVGAMLLRTEVAAADPAGNRTP